MYAMILENQYSASPAPTPIPVDHESAQVMGISSDSHGPGGHVANSEAVGSSSSSSEAVGSSSSSSSNVIASNIHGKLSLLLF